MQTIIRQGRLNRLLSGVGVLIDNGRRHKVPSSQALKQSLLLRRVPGYPFQSPPFSSGVTRKPDKNRTSTKLSIAIFAFILNSIKNLLAKAAPIIINREFSHIFVIYFLRPVVKIIFIPKNILSILPNAVKWEKWCLSPFISWAIVFTLLWQNMIWAGPVDAKKNNNLAPSSRLELLAREGGLRQIVLIIAAHPQIKRLMQLQGQLEKAELDERERIQGQWKRGIRIIDDELARNREGLRVSLQDILFSEDGITIRIRVDDVDLYAQVDKRGEIRIDTGPDPVRKLIGQPLGISAELSIVDGFFERVPDYKGLDYIVISDNPGGVTHKDGLEAIREIKKRFPEKNFNFILTIATKTRRLEEIKERILAGYRSGVKDFLIVSGDLPGEGPDSIQAIQYLKDDRTLPIDIRLGAVENPFSGPSLHERVMRLEKKIQAGADFIITQPVYDLGRFRAWMKRVRKRGLHRIVPIWAGFMPVRDQGLQKRLAQKLGLHLPAVWFSSDMQENYREILEGLVREEGLSGIHIMPLKGTRRLAGYSEAIRKYPSQSVIGRFDLEKARRINRIEELGFEQVNKLRIEGDSVLYKRDGGLPQKIPFGILRGLPSYPVVLLRAPLNSKPAIDALLGLLEKLDLDRFNLSIYLYKEEAPIPAPHHPGFVSGQKGEGASPYVLDFNMYDYTGENISSGFRDYLNEVQLEINYRTPWWHKALLGVLWFFSIERLYKIPLLGCIKCGQCVLSTTAFICIMRHCAKQMRNGPCGDLLPDGRCRLGGECAWHKIHKRLMRWKHYSQWFERRGLYLLANFLDRELLLRQILAPWDKGLSGTSSQLNALRGIIKGVEFVGRPRATLRVEMPGSRDLARDIRKAFRHGGYLAVLEAIDRFHNSRERIKDGVDEDKRRLLGLGLALAAVPSLFSSACRALCAQPELSNLTMITNWIRRNSNTATRLPASHPDSPRHINWGLLYDHSIASIILALANDREGAHRILDFYHRRYSVPLEELVPRKDRNNVVGIIRILPDLHGRPVKGIINGIDIANNSRDGYGTEWYVDSGPQAWLGIALLQVDSRRYINFAKEIGDFILRLQDTDGAIVAGPKGQKTNEREVDRSQLKITEHNLSCYGFLRMLHEVTKDKKYKEAAARIKDWLLTTAYRKDAGYFIQGIHNGIPNGRFASDVQAWAVLALGVNGLGFARAERILKVLKEKAVVQVGDISGLDFTDPRDPTVINERGGYRPMISPEWTAGLIMAYYEMGGTYSAKAGRLYNDMWKLARRNDDRIAFPYATLKGIPTGHGWNTPSGNQSLAGVWMGFVEKRFNPFRLRRTRPGSAETANEVIKKHFLDGAWFTLNDYLARLDEEFSASHIIAKVTGRRDLEKLARRGWVEIDKSRRPYKYRISEKPLEQEEDGIRRLEKRLRELPEGKVITFIFDMDGTLVPSEGESRAVSYGTSEIFRLLKQYGHKVGILTDASMSYTLFILRKLGVDLRTIDYLMPVYDLIGRRLAKDIAEAYGLQDVDSMADLGERLRGLGIRIITHSQLRKVEAFKKMAAMSNTESVVICDDKEGELEKAQQNKGSVRNFIGINCEDEFSSLANNLNNVLWFIDQDVASSIVKVVGYRPDHVSPALYRELLPKARIEIREDSEDPMAEYMLGAGKKTVIFWDKMWDWLRHELDVVKLKIIDASTLVNNSSSDTAIAFKKFILHWLYEAAGKRKWFNLNFAIVNIDPKITREDILNALGLEEKNLGVHLKILDLSKDKDPLKWDGDVTTAYLDTPEHKDFFSQIEGARLIPVTPPQEGEFISGSGVLASVLMDRPDFIDTMPESMREELKGLLVTAEGGLRVPAFRYNESHLPIERESEEYTDRGELLVMPTPVLEIDRAQLEKLGLSDADGLLKAIKKVISFYKIYGEKDVPDYWIDIRKGLKRPIAISGRTITIDIDLLKVPTDYLFPFLLHLAGHEGGHSFFTADHLYEREEEAIVLFIDALRFSRHSRKVQDAIIGAFRSLKGLKDTRYIEFLESLRKDPGQDLAGLIKTTLGIDTRYLEMRIFKNGESPVEISGIDELFSSFKYQKVRWSLVVTRKEYYGQVRIRKKVVLFDERGHLITDEGWNGIEFQYGLGLNSLYWNSIFLKPEHQRHRLGAEFTEKIEEAARLNSFGEEYPSVKIELTPREEKRGYWERLGYRSVAGRKDIVEKRLDINRDYFGLAQRIVPLIIPHINPDAVSQNLPKEGPWDGEKYTHAELLYFIAQDSSGSVASVILDAILSRIGLEPLLGLPDIDVTAGEKTLVQTSLKQLNLDEKNQVLNDILDTIYLRTQRFKDYLARANAVIRLEDFKERLSKYYLLVDIARLDDTLAKRLIELRKQGRIARIIWSSYDIADEEVIRDRLDAFEGELFNIKDIVVPNQAADYTDYLKQILSKNRIPMDRLIIIATKENYDAVYRHIGEALRDVKLSLTTKEFNFLIPYLPGDIVDRFKLAGDRYLLELDPLAEDPRGCIEGLEEAQRELAKAA